MGGLRGPLPLPHPSSRTLDRACLPSCLPRGQHFSVLGIAMKGTQEESSNPDPWEAEGRARLPDGKAAWLL